MSETAEESVPVATATNGSGDAPATMMKNNKPQRETKRDETNIEELYDLTKPIPKVDKPNKDAHDKELQELTDQIEALKQDRAKLQEQIDAAMAPSEGSSAGSSSLQEARVQMQALKLKKNELIEEKKQMRAVMEEAKTTTDKLVKDKKDVKSNLKFSSIEEIEKEIAKLKRRQETTTMSLTDEKKLIKEMEALSASKKYVATLQAKDTAMEDVKEQRKTIQQQIAAKAKEIDAVTKELDQIMNVIKEQNEKDSVKRGSIQGLFQERDSFKGKVAQLIKEKDALRNAYREQNNAWYQNQRAVRAQKQMQYEEEKKRREEEMAAKQALIDAEEAKKVPYEEEQNLCDFLADYLDRTYLSTADNSEKVNTAIKDAPVAVTDDPFAGLQAVSKKDDDDAGYFGKGKGKKKRVRAPKKDGAAGGPFTLSVDSFEQFGLLQLTPPVSIDQVATSVAELRAKKEWYKEQPRGGVPTAAEIRKAKAASSQQSEAAAVAGAKPKAQKVFSLSKDEFAPLGATTTAAVPFSINAAWGQKSATPVEAAADAESAEK